MARKMVPLSNILVNRRRVEFLGKETIENWHDKPTWFLANIDTETRGWMTTGIKAPPLTLLANVACLVIEL